MEKHGKGMENAGFRLDNHGKYFQIAWKVEHRIF
jgi:hypothetical protein